MEARIVEFPAIPPAPPQVGPRTGTAPIAPAPQKVGQRPGTAPTAGPSPASPSTGLRPSSLPPATPAVVGVGPDRLVVERLVLVDPALAAFVAERPDADRPLLVERALRIGLVALQDAGVTVNVDVVRNEFGRLLSQTEQANEKAARALEESLRLNFADKDGRLPRTLEAFLGDRGALRTYVNDLFDETKRDSAIGRMRLLLGSYFDGDASRLATLLDPTRLGSPLHQFRQEVAEGFTTILARIEALQAATQARATERARGTAKGTDFEDLLESMLGELARGSGDLLDRTGAEIGDSLRSKKGDFVLTIDERLSRGAELRVVVEAKDRPLSARQIREELRDAKENRSAAVALIVFTPAHAPTGVAPFDVRGRDVYCVLDPEAPDAATLEAAVRLARLLAIATLDEREVEVDAAAVHRALQGIREQLETIKGLKAQLTSVSNATKAVWNGLDTLRGGVLAKVAEAEAELRGE
ncbi:MAG TPA: hypothetical protein VEY67_01495 [Candidatus Dormibacteraeota bacterium]|nr:hypothetical protein [Candidatus Dormibacteraeota bacterium]